MCACVHHRQYNICKKKLWSIYWQTMGEWQWKYYLMTIVLKLQYQSFFFRLVKSNQLFFYIPFFTLLHKWHLTFHTDYNRNKHTHFRRHTTTFQSTHAIDSSTFDFFESLIHVTVEQPSVFYIFCSIALAL